MGTRLPLPSCTRLLLAGAISALALLAACTPAEAGTVHLSGQKYMGPPIGFPGTGSSDPNRFSLEVSPSFPDDGMDLRFFERKKDKASGAGDDRVLVIKNMAGALLVDQSLSSICAYSQRSTGSRARNVNFRRIVECDAAELDTIRVDGSGGNDMICTISPARVDLDLRYDVELNVGNDAFTGSTSADEATGGPDNDLLRGWSGRDQLHGQGQDLLENPTADRDYVWGEGDGDFIWGGPQDDWLIGGGGLDVICGAEIGFVDEEAWNDPDGGLKGCDDPERLDATNYLFGSEARDIDLDTGTPAPLQARFDELHCTAEKESEIEDRPLQHVQYDEGLDTAEDCPQPGMQEDDLPPQYPNGYPTPSQAAAALGTRSCPPIRQLELTP